MRHEESRSPNLAKVIQDFCERPAVPLSVEEQRRRYRPRRRLPDWVWGVAVGLLVSAVVVTAILLGQR